MGLDRNGPVRRLLLSVGGRSARNGLHDRLVSRLRHGLDPRASDALLAGPRATSLPSSAGARHAASPPRRTGPTRPPGPTTDSPCPGWATPRCCSTSSARRSSPIPSLERRIGLGRGLVKLGPRRLIQPALRKRELPPLDAVLLSHAHMDHTDLGTLARHPAGHPCRGAVRAIATWCAGSTRWTSSPGARRTACRRPGGRIGRDPSLGRPDGHRPAPRLGRLPAPQGGPHRPLRGRHRLHRRVRPSARPGRRWISPSCRSAPTTRGSPATPRPRKPGACSGRSARTYLLPIHHSTFRLSREPHGRADAAAAHRRPARSGGAW